MVSKLIAIINKNMKKNSSFKEDLLDRRGREQLRVMKKRGLDLPVVLLN